MPAGRTAPDRAGGRRLLSLEPALGSPQRIFDVEKLFVGMEADVWAFAVEIASDAHPHVDRYVLKLFARTDAPRATEEMSSLQTIRAIGVRCPRPVVASEETSVFGRPYLLMEKVAGRSLKQVFYETPLAGRDAVLNTFCQVFVDLHRADWRPARKDLMMWDEEDPYGYLLAVLPPLLDRIKSVGYPGLVPVWNWLGEHLRDVPCTRPALLHGDFHPGNVLLPTDSPPVIIDWGGATVGDPRRDLAWSVLTIGAYETQARDRILNEYCRRLGDDIARFEYFEVLACLLRLLSIAESWEYFLDRFRVRGEVEMEMIKLGEHLQGIRRILDRHTGIHVIEFDQISESLTQTVS